MLQDAYLSGARSVSDIAELIRDVALAMEIWHPFDEQRFHNRAIIELPRILEAQKAARKVLNNHLQPA